MAIIGDGRSGIVQQNSLHTAEDFEGRARDLFVENDDFKKLAHDIAMHITAMNPEDNNKLLSQQFVKKPEITINQLIEESIQKFGERIELGNFIKYSLKQLKWQQF